MQDNNVLYLNEGVYRGDIKREGHGSMDYKNGDTFEGIWENDQKVNGIYYFSNGNKYIGEFKNDKINGLGKMEFQNKDKYEGTFKDGKMEGKGIYKTKEGTEYHGNFHSDRKIGSFIIIHPNGSKSNSYYE